MSEALDQAHDFVPPRRGSVWCVAVDSTARAYDLSTLTLGGFTPPANATRRNHVVLYLQAETNDVYFYFDTATGAAIDDTAKQAAGAATVVFANTYCAILKAGNPPMSVRIDRSLDKFLQVKTASTGGNLRLWVASEAR
jgi:hypothetical protein